MNASKAVKTRTQEGGCIHLTSFREEVEVNETPRKTTLLGRSEPEVSFMLLHAGSHLYSRPARS